MKAFFDRNKPIFVIGLITLVAFLVIIAAAQKKPVETPNMVKLNSEDSQKFLAPPEQNPSDSNSAVTETPKQAQTLQSSEAYKDVDTKYGIISIDYTTNGFTPKNNDAVKGQLVRWTNKTSNDIYLQQLMPTYTELKEPVLIKAGGTFEFRLYKTKLWTYQERDIKSFASIFVMEPLQK
jgi:hypothetical protein